MSARAGAFFTKRSRRRHGAFEKRFYSPARDRRADNPFTSGERDRPAPDRGGVPAVSGEKNTSTMFANCFVLTAATCYAPPDAQEEPFFPKSMTMGLRATCVILHPAVRAPQRPSQNGSMALSRPAGTKDSHNG